ncbi:MAG TPA: N-acetylglucosamine-specific PTS transporter subunit IIBC [Steroidobacteraceae bacterium]|nr:N-acetylglucosamine-specific PTS transporter subunit IIBC [Steroidobacteraceae bacterium]
MKAMFSGVQQVGRALMLPIAVLPVAGLLLRLGQPDLLDLAPMAAAGNAIFANLGLLFAIGVAVGLARENHGAAGLASVVGYLVTTKGAEVLIGVPADAIAGFTGQAQDLAAAAYKAHELAKLSVPAGILSGLIAGWLYNRYSDIELPSYLAFFGGRRFVPIASGVVGLGLAALFGWGWQGLEHGMDALSRWVLGSGEIGLFAYGVLNRILIITGLHHVINNIAWFLLGDYNGVTGDLKRFFAGDPSAGAFMSGFFPVMMFGLPAACLAMYRAARPERRRAVGGLLLSMALTAFLTGVTEPIEFTFVFLAPVLYAVHALLTGVAMVVMNLLDVHLGFNFSAGLFDYVLGYSRATHPLLLIPIGLVYSGVYYGLFTYCIRRFDLKTPGREAGEVAVVAAALPARGDDRARAFIAALGGARNLASVDACMTRLRLALVDPGAVDGEALKRLGVRGTVKPSARELQVILGPIADQVAGEMRAVLRAGSAADASPEKLLAALGGASNIRDLAVSSTRLCFTVADDAAVAADALGRLGVRGVARPIANRVHVIVGADAQSLLQRIQPLLA